MDRIALALALILAVASTGCMADDAGPEPAQEPEAARRDRPTVVAVIDTGLNPYHVAFQATLGGVRVDDYGDLIGAHELRELSSEGSFQDRRARDSDLWGNVEIGKLYAFSGTRLLGIALGSNPGIAPLLDAANHGAGTSSLIAREDPNAIILVVRVDATFCNLEYPTERCPIFSDLAVALDWVADQPWIDIVSISMANPGNFPTSPSMHPEVRAYLAASEKIHASGKMLVNGAGNTATPSFLDYQSGPPWVVEVGGAEGSQRGEAPEASKLPDVVANFTEYVATQDSVDGYTWSSGTSLSAPVVAGTLSRALTMIRLNASDGGDASLPGVLARIVSPGGALKEVRSGDFWAALNATAVTFEATEWRPQPASAVENLSLSVPIAAGPIQMGWGYVHAGLAEEIARRIVDGDLTPPPEKDATAQYQAQRQQARQEYWDRIRGL